MIGIYRFEFDCGRMGQLHGIFVAADHEIEQAYGKVACFGDVLGKHSEIDVTLGPSVIGLVTDDPQAVTVFSKYNMETGYNPFVYVE